MSAILNIRGTNASGKSTTVRNVIAHFGVKRKLERDGKIVGYELNGGLFVFGNYERDRFGGAEDLTFSDIKNSVLELAQHGDVIFEGFFWSTVFKASNELAREARAQGHKVYFGLMSTPATLCISRAQQRRETNGNFTPVKGCVIGKKHHECFRSWNRLADAGHSARRINHENPLESVLQLLPERGAAATAA